MSEAIWIELIKVLPAFLWVAFGFIALAVARRIFTAQAPRMTRVETPWVTVELAQQAIEQAAARGPAEPVQPIAKPDWLHAYLATSQPIPPGAGAGGYGGTGALFGSYPLPSGGEQDGAPPQSPPVSAPEANDTDEPFQTEPTAEPKRDLPATPPADGATDDAEADDDPRAAMTAPKQHLPNIPPTYPLAAPPGGSVYYGAPVPPSQSSYRTAPVPSYQAPAYQPTDNGSLRAATRLALAAGELQGGAILWADDHQEWNEPLIRLFRTAGITVDAVTSTDEAVRALNRRSYDLVITDMRREREPEGDAAGTRLLDRMVAAGIPTPAVFFSDNPSTHTAVHPRAITATNSPEQLVDTVVDVVGTRRHQASPSGSGWLDRLRGR